MLESHMSSKEQLINDITSLSLSESECAIFALILKNKLTLALLEWMCTHHFSEHTGPDSCHSH